jgi:hypothetical protein
MNITDSDLLERAIKHLAGVAKRRRQPLWPLVMATFAVGPTIAQDLCTRFELN